MTPLTAPPVMESNAAPTFDAGALVAQQLAEQALSAQFSMALSNFLMTQDADDESDEDDEGFC